MKSTLRIKKINGIEYWYEDIQYYDAETKQIRHQSKYLGRNVNGKPVRVRDAMNSKEETFLPPSKIKNHGSIKRADVIDLCRITKDQAYILLCRLKENGAIFQKGHSRGTFYVLEK
ncbi:MAG: hypothetical protein Q8J68_06920 [Methanolobus sp.]|uniref:hypothetical protein n=1 Tax=Methanolobus sp. TaxID=1874737 RepID=UPI00273132C7|nr:hypothetical protein [Methanolobus sp.]MDP2216995.1 hypothetical protein [Methanolobus sp.]